MKKRVRRKDFEMRFYEKLLQERPDFVQVLASLGDAYTRKGFYEEGLEVDHRLVKLRPDDPIAHYNLACSLSLVGEVGKALAELKKAVLLGYDDFSYILKDPDLQAVRKNPQFDKFMERIEQIKKKKENG
ncbi:MAG: hypothetical protein JSW17_01360 [Candidatus Omnitrophota bacterium]|nr:MAG: hypothetical protein JSW17_01360 [Candidatus Omnitrophota bacterium]